ncbi:YfbM family protein [Polymorphospora sp. NPDC051019]|uniref:YfbM family protein n=1 Tax=Polymorphospora sp. NPDC051019 TaxID=3155725 RepID=UPI003428B5E3
MSSLGVHFAIDEEAAARLLSADDDAAVMAIVTGIEEAWDKVDHCETDKAWDAIHRCLTDGLLGYDNGDYPLNAAVLGGLQVHEDDDYIVSLLTPDRVRDVAEALVPVDRDRLLAGYRAIDVEDYGVNHGAEDFEYTWANFTDLVAFFQRAARDGKHVIFTVDQ